MAYQHLWRMLRGDNATDELFRAWGSAVSAAIQALGWVKTADTGQIDWLTVLRPTVNGQKMGYEIYRAADGLQGSAPWFVRFDYGASPNAASRAGLYIAFGSGTNGAGTLTGASTQQSLDLNQQQATAPRPWLFVGDGAQGILGCIGGVEPTPTDCVWAFIMERTQVKGVPTSVGAVLLFQGYNLSGHNLVKVLVQRWGQAAAQSDVALCLAAINGPRMAGHFDAGSIVHPVFYNLGTGFVAGPFHNAFIVDPGAIPVGIVSDVPHNGATQNFYVAPKPYFYPSLDPNAVQDYRLAVRWE